MTDLRNRAQLLMQSFSVSRADKGAQWAICDSWLFTYPRGVPGLGPMDMVTLYFVQCESKTRSVSVNANASQPINNAHV